MLQNIHPKLPMRDKIITRDFYINQLGFEEFGSADYPGYLMVQKDAVQIHFFEFSELDPAENYGQVYIRTDNVTEWFELAKSKGLRHAPPEPRHWRQIEFSILDPDSNLLTFGQAM